MPTRRPSDKCTFQDRSTCLRQQLKYKAIIRDLQGCHSNLLKYRSNRENLFTLTTGSVQSFKRGGPYGLNIDSAWRAF